MSDIVIRVENLSKRYRIGRRERYLTLRDVLARSLTAPFRLFKGSPVVRSLSSRSPVVRSSNEEWIWALKNVSFEVKQGEVIGIIGRNGAGKSTLLKILARITDPTEGYAEVRGRVGSLLEVGTGFHHELTGRENIYLSGAILGMKKREIDRKFDEIVAFSELEKFIDTPVKYYSSGMYIRLAFAVAAYLDPEILLVDEVLAVGDVAFQNKCLGRMDNISKQGRTVLFVSHNMGAISHLCNRVIVLHSGELLFDGACSEGITRYHNLVQGSSHDELRINRNISFGPILVNGKNYGYVSIGEECEVSVTLTTQFPISTGWLFCIIENERGIVIIHNRINIQDLGVKSIYGRNQLKVYIPTLWLAPGIYSVYFKILAITTMDENNRVISDKGVFIVTGGFERTGRAVLDPPLKWSIRESWDSLIRDFSGGESSNESS